MMRIVVISQRVKLAIIRWPRNKTMMKQAIMNKNKYTWYLLKIKTEYERANRCFEQLFNVKRHETFSWKLGTNSDAYVATEAIVRGFHIWSHLHIV